MLTAELLGQLQNSEALTGAAMLELCRPGEARLHRCRAFPIPERVGGERYRRDTEGTCNTGFSVLTQIQELEKARHGAWIGVSARVNRRPREAPYKTDPDGFLTMYKDFNMALPFLIPSPPLVSKQCVPVIEVSYFKYHEREKFSKYSIKHRI